MIALNNQIAAVTDSANFYHIAYAAAVRSIRETIPNAAYISNSSVSNVSNTDMLQERVHIGLHKRKVTELLVDVKHLTEENAEKAEQDICELLESYNIHFKGKKANVVRSKGKIKLFRIDIRQIPTDQIQKLKAMLKKIVRNYQCQNRRMK